ncbi:MAG: cell division protein FtsW [Anaerolineaceae bacterium]|nr:MAG: cell division protein FtsW [Anaerolineaceae bacterium]
MGLGTFVSQPARKGASAAARRAAPIRGDMLLLVVVIALMIFGLLMLYSASLDFSKRIYEGNATYMFNKQLLWLLLGGATAALLMRTDYHLWQRLAVPVMVVTVGLLIGVLINNQIRFGAVRSFFGGSVQPSELAKLVTVLYLSVWLYAKRDFLHDVQLGLIPLAAILGMLGGLIYIQPDLSAAATIFILGGLLFFLAGGELRQIVLFLIVAVIAGWIVVQFSATGRARLASYVIGLKNPLQSDYQVRRSLEALIRGEWFGLGLGNSITKVTGLPVPPTDSIFAVVTEELGLLGTMCLIGLYGLLLWRGLRIAAKAPDSLGAVMAAGLTFWIVIEAVINMAVMVGLLPFAGNALPFVSYGGSNLVSTLAAIGILFNISRQSGASVPETGERRMYGATVDLRRRDRRRRVSRAGRA